MSEELARYVGEVVDRLVTVQIHMAGGGSAFTGRPIVIDLYDAAREQFGQPLTFLAAKSLIETLRPGDTAIIATGFIVPPYMSAESDGPMGAATLARALDVGLEVTPVLATEAANRSRLKALCNAAGLDVVDFERALGIPHKAAIEEFPIDDQAARKAAVQVLEAIRPKAIITIEKPSRNVRGQYHNGSGYNVSSLVAKADYLIEEARRAGILTIGLGDGGNEIGMGRIAETVRRVVPTGAHCICPCGSGIAAATATDILVVGSIANWAAYGIEACMAAYLGVPAVMHGEDVEQRMLDACVSASIVDPTCGLADGWVDGTPGRISQHVVDMLNTVLAMRLGQTWRGDTFRAWAERRTEVDEKISRWGNFLSAT